MDASDFLCGKGLVFLIRSPRRLTTSRQAACIITERLIQLCVISIISVINSYYSTLLCYKLVYLYGDKTPVMGRYPECSTYFDGSNSQANAAVHAQSITPQGREEVAGAFDMSFAMALGLAFVMHAFGVEIYLQLTSREHNRLRQVSYEKQLEAGFKDPGSAGLTVQQFGDADPWVPKRDDANGSDMPHIVAAPEK
jgi:hypothetical protein